MKKLSPHYRFDEVVEMPEAVRTYLDDNYLLKLQNVEHSNPKLLVVFSGGNAMGKSTLSRAIGKELNGLVIENDAIKRTLLQFNSTYTRTELNQLTWKYTQDLYARLDSLTNNGLIVRDGLIDWYYDRILPQFIKAGYQIFVIGYDISEAKARELITNRGDTPTTTQEGLLEIMADHAIHNKRFRSKYSMDITLNDNNLFDHARVIRVLKQKLCTEE